MTDRFQPGAMRGGEDLTRSDPHDSWACSMYVHRMKSREARGHAAPLLNAAPELRTPVQGKIRSVGRLSDHQRWNERFPR